MGCGQVKLNSFMKRIFFTGVPGSRWSGIAQILESTGLFDINDRTPDREYVHGAYSGHKGAYFGRGMEFDLPPFTTPLTNSIQHVVDSPWGDSQQLRLVKSHDWAYRLNEINTLFPGDGIMMVYRNDEASDRWWHEAGGFNIKYPSYSAYKDDATMRYEIARQNQCILTFAHKHNASWSNFTPRWVSKTFKTTIDFAFPHSDILVTFI
jgi:hypothetical protein